jgi:hypothetical protein
MPPFHRWASLYVLPQVASKWAAELETTDTIITDMNKWFSAYSCARPALLADRMPTHHPQP